ncbi:MAG: polysaccharide deacetylase family protein [Gammaproteobacteria bacterium]
MPILRNSKIVPVLMFHSVGLENHPWIWSALSESEDSFERKLALINEKGYTSIAWDALYGYMEGSRSLPGDSILLTFDDGYLDNWVIAYPILKRLGMKATIFVTPEFVDPAPSLRPTLDDVWAGRCTREQLQVAGFLSFAELRAMEASGLIDVQSHALTHTWYFTAPEIVDFHAPHAVAQYPWLMWNANPQRKPFYLVEDQQPLVPWGYPIFRHEKALIARRFFPDPEAVRAVTDYVAEHGGPGFFRDPEWRGSMSRHIQSLGIHDGFPGHYETDAEREARRYGELATSKRILESELGKRVDYICWPGGGSDETVRRIAAEVGYKAGTAGRGRKRNLRNTDPSSIQRIGTGRVSLGGKPIGPAGPRYQLLRIRAYQNSLWHRGLTVAYKLALLSGVGR